MAASMLDTVGASGWPHGRACFFAANCQACTYIHSPRKPYPLFLQVVIYDFTKKERMFSIEKVSVCKLFDEVDKLALTLGFLIFVCSH